MFFFASFACFASFTDLATPKPVDASAVPARMIDVAAAITLKF